MKRQHAPCIDESTKIIIARKKTLFEIWKQTTDPEKKKDDWKIYRRQSNFFINKVEGMGEKIPHTTTDALDYTKKFLRNKEVPEFEFRTQVSEMKVSDVLSELKNTT